jgi:ribosomal-protein-alanine acetyltransferase
MLRRASLDDLDAIMAIETPTFAADAWSNRTMADELGSPYSFYLVEEVDDEVVAYAGLRHVPGSNDADIQTIAVRGDHRGSGLGRSLMQTLIAQAVAGRAQEVFLDVRVDNERARSLYESLGFEKIGERAGYYPGGIDADVMKLVLR